MKFQILKPSISREELLELMSAQFPSLKEEIEDEDYEDLIHLQVGILGRYSNHQIEVKNFNELKRILDFFEQVVDKVDSVTENALYVSFLEHLELEKLTKNQITNLLASEHLEVWKGLRNS